MTKRNLLATSILLLVGCLFAWLVPSESRDSDTGERPLGPEEEMVVGDSEFAPQAPSVERILEPDRAPLQTSASLGLHVVESGTHVPLRAEVFLHEGADGEAGLQWKFTDEGGLLELDGADALPDVLRIRAFMHERTEVTAADVRQAGVNGLVVELEPRGLARVRVLDAEDVPAPGAHLLWRSTRDNGELLSAEPLETVTDSYGRSKVRSATPFWVSLAGPKGYAARRVLVFPDGRETVIRAGGEEWTIEIVDSETERPLGDFLLRVSESGSTDLRGQEVRTDDSGVVRLIGMQSPLVLEVERAGGAEFVLPQGESPLRMGRNPRKLEVRSPGGHVGTRLTVAVQLCGFHVKCIDAETGEPLSVDSEFRADWLAANGTWFRGLWTAHPLTDGLASLPCFDPDNPAYVDSRIVIRPRGFESAPVDKYMLMSSRGNDSVAETVAFHREQRRVLVFQDAEGNAFAVGNYSVLEAATGAPLSWGATSRKGETDPFHWPGGNVTIDFASALTRDYLVGPSGDPVTLVVSSDTLQRSERVPVVVPWSLGVVEVSGCPEVHEPLILRTQTGVDFIPVRLDEATLVFEDVPLGPCLVGPVSWVESDWERMNFGLLEVWSELDETGRLSLAWDPRWAAQESMDGVIALRGALPGTPFLIPVYGPLTGKCTVGSTARHLRVDEGGRYVLPQGYPVPSLLLICTREAAIAHYAMKEGSLPFRILGSVVPGEDASVDMQSVLLSWPENVEWSGPIMISFELPVERFGLKMEEAEILTWGNRWGGFVLWETPQDLEVRGLLGTEVTFRFNVRNARWTETIRLSASRANQRHLVSPGEAR